MEGYSCEGVQTGQGSCGLDGILRLADGLTSLRIGGHVVDMSIGYGHFHGHNHMFMGRLTVLRPGCKLAARLVGI